jgi:heat shock protein HslJ
MEFTFDSQNLTGNGIVIAESRRTYLVVGFARKPYSGANEINRFLGSFRITGGGATGGSGRGSGQP